MTREEAIKELKIASEEADDKEAAHIFADEILCELLTSLGYEDVVKEWKKVGKWYS